jgi:hypothetical protein
MQFNPRNVVLFDSNKVYQAMKICCSCRDNRGRVEEGESVVPDVMRPSMPCVCRNNRKASTSGQPDEAD